MNMLDAVRVVLSEAQGSLHIRDLTNQILARQLWAATGKTPEDSIRSALAVDVQRYGLKSSFERVGPGTYQLRHKNDSTLAEDEPALLPVPQIASTLPLPAEDKTTYSFTDAAEQVLSSFGKQQPMHYRAITEQARNLGLIATDGKTPEATMYSQIITENDRRTKRGEAARFAQHGKGLVGLSKWLPTGPAEEIEKHNNAVRKLLRSNLYSMPPGEFEQLIGELLSKLGFTSVNVTASSGDGGIDVYGTLVVGDVIRTQMAVQVKRWKHNIQAPIVQQVRGSLRVHDQGLIITTSDFSKGARDEAAQANKTPVALMNGEQLVGLLIEHEILVRRTPYHLLELQG